MRQVQCGARVLRVGAGVLVLAAAMAPGAIAQEAQNVEVDPVTCWWRTGTSSVRVGQPFSLILTCSVLETDAAKAVIDRGRLASSAVQLPPYEVIGGTQSDDLTTASRRFMQYEYTLRLIGDDVFGQDVPIPPLQITYRIESKMQQDGSIQGREQTYILPPLSQHLASLVPANASHIREAPVIGMSGITARETRGNLMRTIGGILFGLSGLVLVVALVRAFQRRRGPVTESRTRFVSDSAILQGVRRELREVQQQGTREGWSPALAARALSALRVTGSYASGQPVAQRRVNGREPNEGQLELSRAWGLGSPVRVSGAATAVDVVASSQNGVGEDLRSALSQLTTARYGRVETLDATDLNAAVENGLRATTRVAAQHTWMAGTMKAARKSAGRWNPRTWER